MPQSLGPKLRTKLRASYNLGTSSVHPVYRYFGILMRLLKLLTHISSNHRTGPIPARAALVPLCRNDVASWRDLVDGKALKGCARVVVGKDEAVFNGQN